MKSHENKAKTIGGRIRLARESASYSQVGLARAVGFESGTAISLIENDERKVTVENLQRIAQVLHRDIKFFLGIDVDQVLDVKVALRADKDLTLEDQNAILHIIELAKKRRHGDK